MSSCRVAKWWRKAKARRWTTTTCVHCWRSRSGCNIRVLCAFLASQVPPFMPPVDFKSDQPRHQNGQEQTARERFHGGQRAGVGVHRRDVAIAGGSQRDEAEIGELLADGIEIDGGSTDRECAGD